MEQHSYCSRCGAPLEARPDGHPRCTACGRISYMDPKLAVAAIVPLDGGIVLIRRGIEPAYGAWSFPSGYVNRGEKVERAIEREVEEECGLNVAARWLVGLYSSEGTEVVLAVYHAEIERGELIAGDETLEAASFPVGQMPELAFDHDERIVADWLQAGRLRGDQAG